LAPGVPLNGILGDEIDEAACKGAGFDTRVVLPWAPNIEEGVLISRGWKAAELAKKLGTLETVDCISWAGGTPGVECGSDSV